MRIKQFTHNDLDGNGSSAVARLFHRKETLSARHVSVDNINDTVEEFITGNAVTRIRDEESEEMVEVPDLPQDYDLIYITDLSVNEAVAEQLEEVHNNTEMPDVALIDHHKTALWLNKYEWATVKVTHDDGTKASGTSLLSERFFPPNREIDEFESRIVHFAELVRQYDTWDWFNVTDNPLPKEMNDYHYLVGGRQAEKEYIDAIINTPPGEAVDYFSETAKVLLDHNRKTIEEYIYKKSKQLVIKDGVGYVFAENYVSELGNKLCIDNPEMAYVTIIDMGKGRVSFRAVGDADVSEVAKKFGGGGHAKAAGGRLNDENAEGLLQIIHTIATR